MKANVKKDKKPKVKLGDKVAGTLFCDIIETLLARYNASAEKETMSFKRYCLGLLDLSYKNLDSKKSVTFDEDEEYYQKLLEEGETDNG